jgi:hypothetical protein
MDKTVRAEGDRALRAHGYSPAEFVRGVWSLLSQRGERVDEMIRLVERGPAARESTAVSVGVAERTEQPARACRAKQLWAELEQTTGLSSGEALGTGYVELPYKDLLEQAYAEEQR